MNYPRIVVTGSLAFDHIMTMPGKFKDHIMPDKIHAINVSFIMNSFRNEFGGTGGNMAYSLAQLETPTLLVGSAGNDFAKYSQHLTAQKLIDLKGVSEHSGMTSAQGFVMTDVDDNQIWGFFEGAMKEEVHISIKEMLDKGDFLIVGPTNPVAMMQFVRDAIAKKVPYMFDPAFNITHFSSQDLSLAIDSCEILIGNDYEIELIRRTIRVPDNEFFNADRIVVTTLGSEGSVVRKGQQEFKIEVAKVETVLDPTGAGDAYRAGFLAGYTRELDLETCAQMASVNGAYAVENNGTQNHNFTLDEFKERFKDNYGKDLSL